MVSAVICGSLNMYMVVGINTLSKILSGSQNHQCNPGNVTPSYEIEGGSPVSNLHKHNHSLIKKFKKKISYYY